MLETIITAIQVLILKYGYLGIVIGIFVFNVVPLISPALLSEALVIFAVTSGLNEFLVLSLATAFSVLASFVSYYLGYYAREKFIKDKRIIKHQKTFHKYGFWAVFIGGIGVIPLHVLSILAGMWKYDIKKYTVAALIGRFIRFFFFVSGAIFLLRFLA